MSNLKTFKYSVSDLVIEKGSSNVGIVTDQLDSMYDYYVSYPDGSHLKFTEDEIESYNDKTVKFKLYERVKLKSTGEEGIIIHIDYNHEKAQLKFQDKSFKVHGFDEIEEVKESVELNKKGLEYFPEKGHEIGKLVMNKQLAYGDSVSKAYKLMQVFLENYDNGDDTYTIPKSLLRHILLQVRIIDKQNRIFSNPDGDLMEENPYADTVGYGLLGMRMSDEQNNQ
jgi:hypothetical protein